MDFTLVFFAILVGYFFRALALKHHKDEKIYAIVGAVLFYVGAMISGTLIFTILIDLLNLHFIFDIPYLYTFLKIAIALGGAYAVHQYLDKKYGGNDEDFDLLD